jgi:Flp pilus assembly protein TadG
LPVFLVVMLGIFDFGRAVYAFNTISNSARGAGREAIVNQNPTAIENVALRQSIALGVAAADVSICYEDNASVKRTCATDVDNCDPKEIGCLALVEVRYRFAALTPLIGAIVGPITMSSTTVLPLEAVADRAPAP